jgi:mannose-6-phosphate isomerase-like protein (cupin superfamily)
MKPVLLKAGEGERLAVGAASIVIKATGDDTGGTFYLGETEVPPGFPGPPLHVHDRLHDMFLVIEGTLTLRLGDEEQRVEAGTFVCIPPGVVHTFSNPGDTPVRFFNFNTPAGWESYMRDLAAAASEGRTPTPEEIGRIASKYDFRPV